MSGFREIFSIRRVNNTPLKACFGKDHSNNGSLPGFIASTLPFHLEDGRSFVAIACSEGIWVANPRDPDFTHRVIDLKSTTGFMVIEEYQLLLVLAEKTLYCLSMSALDPYSQDPRVPQLLSGNQPVDFFRIGIWDTSLVIILVRKKLNQSTFSILEPVRGAPLPDVLDPVIIADLGSGKLFNFILRKEFYIPAACTDVIFLRLTIAIVCPLSFEVLDLETLVTGSIPIKTEYFKSVIKQHKPKRALGLFRGKQRNRHILCYDTFGLIVDGYGVPIAEEESVIDWRGVVHTVAAVSPYFVLFKANSIEVRDGATGRLEQVMFGTNLRCTWRGPGVLQGELDEDDLIPDSVHERSRLQVVMNSIPVKSSDEVLQHVYDFIRK